MSLRVSNQMDLHAFVGSIPIIASRWRVSAERERVLSFVGPIDDYHESSSLFSVTTTADECFIPVERVPCFVFVNWNLREPIISLYHLHKFQTHKKEHNIQSSKFFSRSMLMCRPFVTIFSSTLLFVHPGQGFAMCCLGCVSQRPHLK